MNNQFSPENFFDLSGVDFSSIFSEVTYTWEAVSKISVYIKEQFETGKIKSNYKELDMVYIGKNTIIEEGVLIKGPVIIGDNCLIGHGSLIRENVLLASGVKIGHAAEIKNSILLKNTAAAHFNYVGDSIIGNNVNLSGGSMLANFRLDKKNVIVKSNQEHYETNLRKFGSIIGDGSNVGVNAVLNPGTILGKNVIVFPLVSVRGVHEPDEVIKQTS